MKDIATIVFGLQIENVRQLTVSDCIRFLRGGSLSASEVKSEGVYRVMNGAAGYSGFYDTYNAQPGMLTVSHWGSSSGYIHYHMENFWANNACWLFVPVSDQIDAKYLYYVLKKDESIFRNKYSFGGATPNLSRSMFLNHVIPIPPLPVQREIVRILDSFTELTAELTTELTTELTARRLQYESYRNKLLTFDDGEYCVPEIAEMIERLCPEGVESKSLEDCCLILDNKRKPVTKVARESGDYPYYGANGIQDYVSDYIFDGTFILIGEDGSVVTADGNPVVNWAEGKIWVNNHAHIISEKDDILLRYLYHYLQTVDVSKLIHGNIPKLTGGDLKAISIPVPPLPIQQAIVNILDRFDALCNDLTEGLPAEIAARQKQYEYYRNRLLSFREA